MDLIAAEITIDALEAAAQWLLLICASYLGARVLHVLLRIENALRERDH